MILLNFRSEYNETTTFIYTHTVSPDTIQHVHPLP